VWSPISALVCVSSAANVANIILAIVLLVKCWPFLCWFNAGHYVGHYYVGHYYVGLTLATYMLEIIIMLPTLY
jgi:hypothetical protein